MRPIALALALIGTSAVADDTRPRDIYGWVPCSPTSAFSPLSDAEAAALVVRMTENRPGNATANGYLPSSAELDAFLHGETNVAGSYPADLNPYAAYVTGGFAGTTDEIIQWGAAKWGIPADWLRAQYAYQSGWDQSDMRCLTTVADSTQYPAFTRVSATQIYRCVGITSIGWDHPDGNSTAIGTEPLRWKSTAFSVDYQAAWARYYFDDPQGSASIWIASYSQCDHWGSIGGWWYPTPWNSPAQQAYVSAVQGLLIDRVWKDQSFPPAQPDPGQFVTRCDCGAASGGLSVPLLLAIGFWARTRRSSASWRRG